MKYYVISDPHSFCGLLQDALIKAGYYHDKGEKKVVLCGDAFDRGPESRQMELSLVNLLNKGQLIYIRGNHEDLIEDFAKNVRKYIDYGLLLTHHWSNGTVQTVCSLTGENIITLDSEPERVIEKLYKTDYFQRLLPASIDYFETLNHIFTHGWIPCRAIPKSTQPQNFYYNPEWRKATKEEWGTARWYNGMKAASQGAVEPGKTIVCGHYHCSYGHAMKDEKKTEFGEGADFTPYYADGIIAIDACTAYSGVVNCIVIEDEE